jgi:hypothetical protein
MALAADHQVIVDGNAQRLGRRLISRVISMSSRDGLRLPDGWLCIVPREYEFPLLRRDLGDLRNLLGSWSGACFSCLLVSFN